MVTALDYLNSSFTQLLHLNCSKYICFCVLVLVNYEASFIYIYIYKELRWQSYLKCTVMGQALWTSKQSLTALPASLMDAGLYLSCSSSNLIPANVSDKTVEDGQATLRDIPKKLLVPSFSLT